MTHQSDAMPAPRPMLRSFGLANFKAFGQDVQRLELKPLTLVFGPNSSGKSSLVHSLLLAHHAAHFDGDLGGRRTDLGGKESDTHRDSRSPRDSAVGIVGSSQETRPVRPGSGKWETDSAQA